MINGREPNYICLDVRALKVVQCLPELDRLAFYDGLYASYIDKLNGTTEHMFPDDVIGILIQQAAETMREGFDTYMKKVHANPIGKKTHDTPSDPSVTPQRVPSDSPLATQWIPSDPQSNINQSNINKDNINQSNQIMEQLIEDGYTESEITSALAKCDLSTLRNPVGYIRTIIDNKKKQASKGRKMPAYDFPQRDYSNVDQEMMDELEREVQKQRLEHPEYYDKNGRIKA